jgi:hypothetical protein
LGRGEVSRRRGTSVAHRPPGEVTPAVGTTEPEMRAIRSDIGADVSPNGVVGRATVRQAEPAPDPETWLKAVEPSWGRVLATTISLWLSRRLPSGRIGCRHSAAQRSRTWFRWPSWRLRHPSARGLRLSILVLALIAVAVTVLRFTVISSPAARPSSTGSPRPTVAEKGAARADAALRAAAQVRSQAAAWIAEQVNSSETVACDPAMCAALRARGIATNRLLPLQQAATGSSGAGVIVSSSAVRGQSGSWLGDNEAPVLIASFGSGNNVIEVRAAAPGGAGALQADLAARRSAGTQLLRSRRIEVSTQAAEQVQLGDVDTRLLVTLVGLASLQPLRVIAFADASPGGQVPFAAAPFRQVIIASVGSRIAAARFAAEALAMMHAQRPPYQPAQVAVIGVVANQVELRVEFAAPSPPGLLSSGASG